MPVARKRNAVLAALAPIMACAEAGDEWSLLSPPGNATPSGTTAVERLARSTSLACTRFLITVRCRTRNTRPRSACRRVRAQGSGTHNAGSIPTRANSASLNASIGSVFVRVCQISFICERRRPKSLRHDELGVRRSTASRAR